MFKIKNEKIAIFSLGGMVFLWLGYFLGNVPNYIIILIMLSLVVLTIGIPWFIKTILIPIIVICVIVMLFKMFSTSVLIDIKISNQTHQTLDIYLLNLLSHKTQHYRLTEGELIIPLGDAEGNRLSSSKRYVVLAVNPSGELCLYKKVEDEDLEKPILITSPDKI